MTSKTLIQNACDIVRENGAKAMFDFLTAQGMMDKTGIKSHQSTASSAAGTDLRHYYRMRNQDELCVFKWHEIDDEIIFSVRDLKNHKYLGTHGKRHMLKDNATFAHLEIEEIKKDKRWKIKENYGIDLF